MKRTDEETCWTMILAAARGDAEAKTRFALLYLDIVRAYLGSRWRGGPFLGRLDDAVQDVFLECFRSGGALSDVERDEKAAFRTFLFAVVRNIARRHEEGRGDQKHLTQDSAVDLDRMVGDPGGQEAAFDRAWAAGMMERAKVRQRRMAEADGERGRRRLELLELRFQQGMPIRDIAKAWGIEADQLHAEYRRAREEFRRALEEEVAFQGHQGSDAIEAECHRLLSLLGGSA